MKKVIFVCTANYYRSRFAEAWFNAKKPDSLNDWKAESRGLMIECAPTAISPHTREAVHKHEIEPECYQPHPIALKQEDFTLADLVIALKETEHRPMMDEFFPAWSDEIRYWEVHDLDVWGPDQTLPAIIISVGLLFHELEEQVTALED